MKQSLQLRVNGANHEIHVEPWWSLGRVLREEFGLTGLKIGCGTGNCGWCTVIVNGKTYKSCLYLALKARDSDILTIEGLQGSNGDLHPLQESFVEHFATQCGYCIPGMILSAKPLIDSNPAPTEAEVKEAIGGTLCRCTGYVKIVEAIMAAADKVK